MDMIDILLAKALSGGSGGGGSGGGVFVVGLNFQTGTLDKTAREIMDAALQKQVCVAMSTESETRMAALVEFIGHPNSYLFKFGENSLTAECESENDYPVFKG